MSCFATLGQLIYTKGNYGTHLHDGGLAKVPAEILEVVNQQVEKLVPGKKLYSSDTGADDYLIGLFKANN